MILFGSHVKGITSERSDLDILFVIPNRLLEKEVLSVVGSVERISPIGIHEITLTSDEFIELLKHKTSNIAWEVVDNHIIPYGAQVFFRMLEEIF
jgi:predicted nucleotidyltransferase